MRFTVIRSLILCITLGWAKAGVAGPSCKTEQRATLVSLQGTVYFDADSKGEWRQAQLDEAICQNGRVRVEPYSRATLSLPNGVVLRLDAGTVLSLHDITRDEPTALDLLKGFIHFISRTPKHLEITSPMANAGPEGTEFAMQVDETKASLWVYEGAVRFFNHQGSIRLSPGQGADALDGQAPRAQIEIKPQDAVNWALYYPPLLPYPKPSASLDASLRIAIEDFRRGRVDQALMRLDALAPEQRTPYFFKVRGAVRLTAGRVALAREDIRSIFATNPNDAEALALLSVLALTQNRKEEALQLANKAVASDPASPTAYSALSYAEQGRFELDKALAAAEKATRHAPHDAMVWARKAELQLAQGATKDSEQAARRALELDPSLERTQTVTGFSYLLRMETAVAKQAFEQAVKLDSTSPLARLGLGLAKIRDGNLEEGRHDLEIAAILDPNNSLTRSYLGKAYYEEKRNVLAEDQFRLAKERDPKDPTPYFYDALKKQTENRPVEALQDLQQTIALNDNRAVYRSRQLLDADRAIRGASLARIYDTLGFEQRGILEASKSVSLDPTNYSAHRFLSDSYIRFPTRGAAQTSELLQAQLLQPININPIQPHLSVSNRSMPIGLGVSEPLFRDFTRVFERNRPQLTVSGFYGNLDTNGDESVISGIYNNFSYSFGQYHFTSDGFRTNADINHDIYNAFIQTEICEKLNIQFEYLHRETDQGDLVQDLNPRDRYSERFFINQDKFRGGFHLKPFSNVDLIGTAANLPSDDTVFRPDNDPNLTATYSKGWSGDLQLIFKTRFSNLLIGGRTYQRNSHDISRDVFNEITYSPVNVDEGNNFYAYSYTHLPFNILATLGVKHSFFNLRMKDPSFPRSEEYSRWEPKIGIQWAPNETLTFRFAYTESLKQSLFSDQTIEPTQIAGFNQLYDDFNGQFSDLYAAAIDISWHKSWLSGFQFNRRDIGNIYFTDNEKPIADIEKKRQSDIYRAYLYWTINKEFTFTTEYIIERDNVYKSIDINDLTTYKLPVGLRYFNENGIFSQVGITYVSQNQTSANTPINNVSESFIVADAAIGFRLPKRLGVLSLEVRNLLDKHFNYNDKWRIEQADIFRMNRQQDFLPTRTILARILLNF